MSTSDPQQQQMIRDAMKSIAERKPGRTKLVYDKTKRTIVAVAEGTQTPRALNITADDADMFAVATISTAWLRQRWDELSARGFAHLALRNWDNGDAWTHSELGIHTSSVFDRGIVTLDNGPKPRVGDAISIVLSPVVAADAAGVFVAPNGTRYRALGHSYVDGKASPIEVSLADVQPELATRRTGLLESSILADKTALLIGLGTGGAHVALELAKCGVGSFVLLDHDRLGVGNVVRHPGGVSQAGRYKVNVVRDLILDKNPQAQVLAVPLSVDFSVLDEVRAYVRKADVVVCGTDSRPSKLLVNRLCVEADVVALYGGAFRRAYGGQILRVRPRQSPCHQCFVAAMPDAASDVEVSTAADADAVAYSDRPVAVEPGLSLDVLPIANMLGKLTLLELIAEKESSLNILKRDFEAPWYLWLNRPEAGTQYATMPPLSDSVDEMTICRWYGVEFERDPECSVCGNFLEAIASSYGVTLPGGGDVPQLPGKET
ncbi:MAG: HesA/MoeB/ThiF family protein [Planctomycetota bacterium]